MWVRDLRQSVANPLPIIITMPPATLVSQQYGKTNVKVVKIRDLPTPAGSPKRQTICELTATVLLHGTAFTESYTLADNSLVVPTDTVKNTIYFLAKTSSLDDLELFGLDIARHFLSKYSHVSGLKVDLEMLDWTRIKTSTIQPVTTGTTGCNLKATALQEHPHSFYRAGAQRRLATLLVKREGKGMEARVSSGIKDLLVLKTTASSFVGYHKDELTTLPPMNERVFSTTIESQWNYPALRSPLTPSPSTVNYSKNFEIVRQITLDYFCNHDSPSVQNTLYRTGDRVLQEIPSIETISYTLPNKHVFLYDLERFGKPNKIGNDAVLYPVADPSGLISATIGRTKASL